MRVLIAEDDAVSRRLLEAKLSKWGYATVTTNNGEEAWGVLQGEDPPRLSILDWMMPGIDGIELCRKIREGDNGRHFYLILLTALQREEDLVLGMEAGADDYIVKPFKSNELRVRLNAGKRILEIQQELLVAHESLCKETMALKQTSEALNHAYAELKTTQSQMLQREKMASIGQLAAGVAHEINNPLGFIRSNLGTLGRYTQRLTDFIQTQSNLLAPTALKEKAEELEKEKKRIKLDHILIDLPQLLAETIEGTERVSKIVQNLKSFARLDEIERKRVNLNDCLESTLNIVWNEIKYCAEVKKEYGDLPEVECNPGQINQVFMNLLLNAAHAIGEHGTITLRSLVTDGFVQVDISDTGCGIPEAAKERIFEPFFTTKAVGSGTGLGLSIAFDIMKKHGGELRVASEVEVGTTFSVVLPLEKHPADEKP